MTIGENIKRYRVRKHMTQSELAEAIGVTYRMLQKYEAPEDANHNVIPSVAMIRKIAEVLEVNIANIIEDPNYIDLSTSINDYYEKLTEKKIKEDKLNLDTDPIKVGAFNYVYKTIYNDYQLEKQTQMDVSEFILKDRYFVQNLYEQISSLIIGATIQNLVKIKLGKNVPSEVGEEVTEEPSATDWNVVYRLLELIDDRDKLQEVYKILKTE